MKPLLILLAIAFSFSAFAQKVKVHVVDPYLDPSSLEGEYNVTSGSPASALPDIGERDAFFHGVPQAKDWDDWERDKFYVYLQKKSVSEMHQRYPQFTVDELKALKEKVKK